MCGTSPPAQQVADHPGAVIAIHSGLVDLASDVGWNDVDVGDGLHGVGLATTRASATAQIPNLIGITFKLPDDLAQVSKVITASATDHDRHTTALDLICGWLVATVADGAGGDAPHHVFKAGVAAVLPAADIEMNGLHLVSGRTAVVGAGLPSPKRVPGAATFSTTDARKSGPKKSPPAQLH